MGDSMKDDSELRQIERLITIIPDFPKPGILFRDIFPIFKQPEAVNLLMESLMAAIKGLETQIDVIAGLDARGFLFGPCVASRLGCSFVPVRKRGKLPGKTINVSYQKEYGEDSFEIHQDAIAAGSNVLILDDLLATGGSAFAASQLIKLAGGNPIGAVFIVELMELEGARRLEGVPVRSLFQY